jgi:hypothetical protein
MGGARRLAVADLCSGAGLRLFDAFDGRAAFVGGSAPAVRSRRRRAGGVGRGR